MNMNININKYNNNVLFLLLNYNFIKMFLTYICIINGSVVFDYFKLLVLYSYCFI